MLKWVVKNESCVQTRVTFCINPTTNIGVMTAFLLMEQSGLFIKIPYQLGRSRGAGSPLLMPFVGPLRALELVLISKEIIK